MDKETTCPLCGKKIEMAPKPGEPNRLVGYCKCHPVGAVLETDAAPEKPHKKSSRPNVEVG